MIPFILGNFAAILAACVLAFVAGIALLIVGKLIERHYTAKLRRIERAMSPDQWAAWSREQGRYGR